MLLLETNHIQHYVKDRLLLDTNPLRINVGDRVGLVGTNGSGKTTLLKILAKKLKPDKGVHDQVMERVDNDEKIEEFKVY